MWHTLGGAALLAVQLLTGCGDKVGEATKAAQQAVEKATGKNKVKLKDNTPQDIAAYAVTSVMSSTFKDYHINGDTVRLIVKDGVTLSGSECSIIGAATKTDHPNVTFVIDDHSQTTTC